jgi:hypothetical protein
MHTNSTPAACSGPRLSWRTSRPRPNRSDRPAWPRPAESRQGKCCGGRQVHGVNWLCGDGEVGESLERPGDHNGSKDNVPLWLASDFHAPASRGLEPGTAGTNNAPWALCFWSLSCLNGIGVAASVPALQNFSRSSIRSPSSCDISLSERRATVPGEPGLTICCRTAPSRPGYS